jgi:hypothetical protein
LNVLAGLAVDDRIRPDPVEACVEKQPCLVVGRVTREDDVAAEAVRELVVDARSGQIRDAPSERDDTGDERDLAAATNQLPAGDPFHAPNLAASC